MQVIYYVHQYVHTYNPSSCYWTDYTELKIAVSHRPFSEQNWLFPNTCKNICPFFRFLNKYFVHHKTAIHFCKWLNTCRSVWPFVHILSIPYFELCYNRSSVVSVIEFVHSLLYHNYVCVPTYKTLSKCF